MSVENVAVNAASIGFGVAVLLGIVKVWVPGKGTTQDSITRLLAIALGVIAAVANYLVNTTPATGPGIEGSCGIGFSAGIVAMGLYHTYNGDVAAILGSVSGGTTPAPAPQPAPRQTLEKPPATVPTGTAG